MDTLNPIARTAQKLTAAVQRNMGSAADTLFVVMCCAIFVFLLLPTIVVIPVSFSSTRYMTFPPEPWSFRWYVDYFHDDEWLRASWLSLEVAILATATSLVLGTLAALALKRSTIPGKGLIRAIALTPMIVPHIVIAVSVYIFFMQLHLTGTLFGFVIAHTIVCIPFVLINVSAGLEKLDTSLDMAASSLGATRLAAFYHVTLPLVGPSFATSAAFAFITSLDEAVISYFLSDSTSKTITKKMFEDIDFNLSPVIAVVSTLILIFSVVTMGSIELLRIRSARRKIG